MDVERVAPALREKLGLEATAGLLGLLDVAQEEWATAVITAAVDRFEHRLTTESAGLRVSMAEQGAKLRQEMAEQGVQLRREVVEQIGQLRQGIHEGDGKLRLEMNEQFNRIRVTLAELGTRVEKDNADSRFALLKWSFAFWIGQVVAMAAVMAVMLRLTGH